MDDPYRLEPSLTPHKLFYLITQKERVRIPIPSYYEHFFNAEKTQSLIGTIFSYNHDEEEIIPKKTINTINHNKIISAMVRYQKKEAEERNAFESRNGVIFPYSRQDACDIAEILNKLDKHQLSSAIKRCQEKPDLIKKLEDFGFKSEFFKPVACPIAFSESDQQTINLFLQYREELEKITDYEKSKSTTPLVCMSTYCSYNPFLLLLKKEINHIDLTIIKENQKNTIRFNTVNTHYNQLEKVEISPNGEFLVGKIGTILYVLNTITGNLLFSFDVQAQIEAFAITPDAKHILVATPGKFYLYELTNNYGQFFTEYPHEEYNISCLAISPNSSFIVTGQENGHIAFYEWKNNNLIKCYKNWGTHNSPITSIIIKGDNILIADEKSFLCHYSFKLKNMNREYRRLNVQYNDMAIKRMILIDAGRNILVESMNKYLPPFSPQFAVHPSNL